jgi:hypothetical protein
MAMLSPSAKYQRSKNTDIAPPPTACEAEWAPANVNWLIARILLTNCEAATHSMLACAHQGRKQIGADCAPWHAPQGKP